MKQFFSVFVSLIFCVPVFSQNTGVLQIQVNVNQLTGLCNLSASNDTVYMYSGLGWSSPDSVWQTIVGEWGVADGKGAMTNLGNGIFSICFDVVDYYTNEADPSAGQGGVGDGPMPPGATPYNIGLVFRAGTCPVNNQTGKRECTDGQTGKDENCQNIYIIGINDPNTMEVLDDDGNLFSAVTAQYIQAGACPSLVSNGGSSLIINSDSIVNYFDTLHVAVSVQNAVDFVSVGGTLHFDSSRLQLVNSSPGNFLGNYDTGYATTTGGSIAFDLNTPGSQTTGSGNGLVYSFEFVLTNLPNIPFNALSPDSVATLFHLNNPIADNTSGPVTGIGLPGADTAWLRYYVPVWPGDLNNDHVVNVADILPIGYFYNYTGPVRPNATTLWTAQPAQLWGFDKITPISNAYETFADANGDGIIDSADLSAINFNSGDYHSPPPPSPTHSIPVSPITERSVLPPLQITTGITQIDSSQLPYLLNVSVNLGSQSQPVNGVLGLAFDLLFNAECADIDSLNDNSVTYSSLFGALGTDYIRISDFSQKANGKISFGITRIGTGTINAQGDNVLNVQFKVTGGCNGGWFRIIPNILASDSGDGNANPLIPAADSVQILASPTMVTNIPVKNIKIYPNPANTEFFITGMDGASKYTVEIVNTLGQQTYYAPLNENHVDISKLAAGIYFVNLVNGAERYMQKLVVAR